MKHKILITLFSLGLMLSLGSVERVLGCSCAEERPVCEAFGGTDVVFVGKVIGGKQKTFTNDGVSETWTIGEIHFQVEEGFLGVQKGNQITIRSGTGGGDCGYWFKSGETYLVYSWGDAKKGFFTNICTRTRPIIDAKEDLISLRGLASKNLGAKLSGEIREEIGLDDYTLQNTKPSKGINILLHPTLGKGKVYKAKTDADGKFEISGIPAGKFKVTVLLSQNKKLNRWSRTELKSNGFGCLTQWAVIENKNELKGKVIDAEGKPVTDAYTVLISADSDFSTIPKSDIPADSVDSDKNGNFTYTGIPAGRYILAVNYTYPPNNEGSDYPTTFYPNVNNPLQAKPIVIGESDKIRGIIFQLPPKKKVIKVTGKLLWSNGEPVGNFWGVSLIDIDYGGDCSNCWGKITNSKGEFEIYGYEGRKYRLEVDGKITVAKDKVKEFKTKSDEFILDQKTSPFILTLEKLEDIAKNKFNQ
jgi:hypothetical protein